VRSALAPEGRLPHVDALTARAFAGRLPRDAIAAEIERQYDRFEALIGRPPAFVDGHQHVHVLPGIRGIFLDIARRRAPGAWIRTCEESLAKIRRRGIFRWTAIRSSLLSRGLSARAAGLGLATNHGFAGLYDFHAGRDYGDRLEVMSGLREGDSIVANPGDVLNEGTEVEPVRAAAKAEPQSAGK